MKQHGGGNFWGFVFLAVAGALLMVAVLLTAASGGQLPQEVKAERGRCDG